MVSWVGSTLLASLAFWSCFGACVADSRPPDAQPLSRVVASWDPLACGAPHRVVLELEDEDGRKLSQSVPCELGGMTIDVGRWGVYIGRIYAWVIGPEIRSVAPVRIDVDGPVIYWTTPTPA